MDVDWTRSDENLATELAFNILVVSRGKRHTLKQLEQVTTMLDDTCCRLDIVDVLFERLRVECAAEVDEYGFWRCGRCDWCGVCECCRC